MAFWIIAGAILALAAAVVTLAWWKVGDQWADDEYKKFGHGGGRNRAEGPAPTVIKTTPDKTSPS
jgi:hypothetical protein